MMTFRGLYRAVFRPPFSGLPYAVFAFFVLSFTLHPQSPIYTHHLADPDDYMRLNEVVSWFNGQSWYDLSVPRLSPGAHTIVHWARLVDLPIAMVALPFIPFLGIENSALIASFIVPFMWFACLLVLVTALGREFLDGNLANVACVMVLFAPTLLFDFTPGRVDHHNIQTLIAAFGVLCFCRLVRDDNSVSFSVFAALVFSCGLWIGTEALPWLVLFIAVLVAAAAWEGPKLASRAAVFGLSLTAFTFVLIPIALAPAEYSSRALSWFSPAFSIFAALSGSIFVLGYGANFLWSTRRDRLIVYSVLSVGAAVTFFLCVPNALHGPFGDYDTFDATTALDNISEAQPFWNALHVHKLVLIALQAAALSFLRLLALPCAGLCFCLYSVVHSQARTRWMWVSQVIFLGASIALTLFYQVRVCAFMEVFAVVPVTALLLFALRKLRGIFSGRPLFWAEITVFVACGMGPVVFVPAIAAHTSFYPDLLLFTAARAAPSCSLDPVIPYLNDAARLGSNVLTIMNSSDTGPELLFSTHHQVIAGNFDVAGNADAFRFFSALDDRIARAAAEKWHTDLVLFCRTAPSLYLGKEYNALNRMRLQTGPDGLLRLQNADAHQPLIERLIRGQIPTWLKPIEIPDGSDYLLFRVQNLTGPL